MKLVNKDISKDGSGTIRLVPEEQEDMWHSYLLIVPGDALKSTTIRRVVSESATGSTDKSTVRINLTIQVETVEYDKQACMLRVNGRNIEENKFVKMGGYHTIDLELNRPYSLSKMEWDIISLERITTACDVATRADVAAVVFEEGLANFCLLTQNMTIVRQRLEMNVPRKRKGSSNHEKATQRFFDQIYQGILKHFALDIVKVIILASPGFIKDQLLEYIKTTAIRTDNKPIIQFLPKFLLVHCSSGQKHALGEALSDPGVQSRLSDTKFAREVKMMEAFYITLANDPTKAFYGMRHVEIAANKGAVETLMITDELFRSADVPTRKRYIALVEVVRSFGGAVYIFSSLHTSGEQLTQLTGVACMCSFPLPELDDEVEEEEEATRTSDGESMTDI
ncbi:hypothetical protein HDU67_007217 [Dinochytrium kinnereticum]|nr:hypothetical protein HDU67_007217 [Dinochytrium kinnereticum]